MMFDALEKKFEGTDQADMIKRLYEGRLISCVSKISKQRKMLISVVFEHAV